MAVARFFLPGGAYSATSAPVVATRAPTPKPVRKPQQSKHRHSARQRGYGHSHRKPRVGGEHHLPTTDDVADGTGEQRADQHADQRIAAECTGHRGRYVAYL